MAVFFLTISTQARADFGVGIVVGDPTGLTIRNDKFPVVELGWSFITNKQSLNVNVDYWMMHSAFFSTPFKYFIGIGGHGSFSANSGKNNNSSINLGVRIPLGLQWVYNSKLEVYLSAAPTLSIIPASSVGVAGALGVRFLF